MAEVYAAGIHTPRSLLGCDGARFKEIRDKSASSNPLAPGPHFLQNFYFTASVHH